MRLTENTFHVQYEEEPDINGLGTNENSVVGPDGTKNGCAGEAQQSCTVVLSYFKKITHVCCKYRRKRMDYSA